MFGGLYEAYPHVCLQIKAGEKECSSSYFIYLFTFFVSHLPEGS